MRKFQGGMFGGVFILQECLLLFFLLSAISFPGVPQKALAEEPGIGGLCCVCHNDTCEVNLDKTTVHLPFLQKQCAICHVDDSAVLETVEDDSGPKEITWLGGHYTPAPTHWFVIPVDLVSRDKLIVTARDVTGKSHEVEMSLPAIETLQLIENDNKPPVITSPEIIGVYSGITTSVRIGWFTDKESDSEIRYGIDSLQYSVKAMELTVKHEIVLQNLKTDQKYQYIVISRDIFNNTAESGMAFFSTENLSPDQSLVFEEQQIPYIQLDAQFFRNDDSYIVKITANQPVILSVVSETINEKDPATFIVNHPSRLPPLRSGKALLTSACLQCHGYWEHSFNHPLNISPSQKVTIPADYATSSAGRITCTTCHASHASNFQFRTVRSASHSLCKGCHGGDPSL
jgi:predicted CXXCH cytochrome family protein